GERCRVIDRIFDERQGIVAGDDPRGIGDSNAFESHVRRPQLVDRPVSAQRYPGRGAVDGEQADSALVAYLPGQTGGDNQAIGALRAEDDALLAVDFISPTDLARLRLDVREVI